jgi:hypothetical protein
VAWVSSGVGVRDPAEPGSVCPLWYSTRRSRIASVRFLRVIHFASALSVCRVSLNFGGSTTAASSILFVHVQVQFIKLWYPLPSPISIAKIIMSLGPIVEWLGGILNSTWFLE